jgi:hypothetical protein
VALLLAWVLLLASAHGSTRGSNGSFQGSDRSQLIVALRLTSGTRGAITALRRPRRRSWNETRPHPRTGGRVSRHCEASPRPALGWASGRDARAPSTAVCRRWNGQVVRLGP